MKGADSLFGFRINDYRVVYSIESRLIKVIIIGGLQLTSITIGTKGRTQVGQFVGLAGQFVGLAASIRIFRIREFLLSFP